MKQLMSRNALKDLLFLLIASSVIRVEDLVKSFSSNDDNCFGIR